jgi:hypothetical protein
MFVLTRKTGREKKLASRSSQHKNRPCPLCSYVNSVGVQMLKKKLHIAAPTDNPNVKTNLDL